MFNSIFNWMLLRNKHLLYSVRLSNSALHGCNNWFVLQTLQLILCDMWVVGQVFFSSSFLRIQLRDEGIGGQRGREWERIDHWNWIGSYFIYLYSWFLHKDIDLTHTHPNVQNVARLLCTLLWTVGCATLNTEHLVYSKWDFYAWMHCTKRRIRRTPVRQTRYFSSSRCLYVLRTYVRSISL